MGNSSSKRMNTFLQYISENGLKETEPYSELHILKDDFENDGDFKEIYKNVQNMTNISSLFKFLIHTFNKCAQDPKEKNVQECKICVKLLLCIFPCIQYNYKKKDVFRLFWEKDYFNFSTYGLKYRCENVLILHLFNLLLILLFTENLCIKKYTDGSHSQKENQQEECATNTLDVKKLWARHILINKGKQNGERLKSPLKHKKSLNKETFRQEDNGKNKMGKQNESDVDVEKMKLEESSSKMETKIKTDQTVDTENDQLYDDEVFSNNDTDFELIKNRLDILKCLLILLSTYIYFDHSTYLKEKNFFLFFFTSGEICNTANFFVSLINVIYDNEFNYRNSLFFNDMYTDYYNLCLHILNILIDFHPFLLKGEKMVHYMNSPIKHFYKFSKKMTTKNVLKKNVNVKEKEHEHESKEITEREDKRNVDISLNNTMKVEEVVTENNMGCNSNPLCLPVAYSSIPSSCSFKTVTFTDISEEYVSSSSSSDSEQSDSETMESNVLEKIDSIEGKTNPPSSSANDMSSFKEEGCILLEKEEFKEYFGCSNVFYDMFRELGSDNIKYIYSGVLNMLISFKMYTEEYDEDLPFLENYIFLLWHFIDHNSNFVKYLKTHNSNIFLYYLFYILLYFNNCRKKEIQKCASKKREKNETLQVCTEDTHKFIRKEDVEKERDDLFFHNEYFLKSNKCDEFGVRKIDGLIYICLFIMIKISSKRIICKKLNEKCEHNSKRKINFLKHINDFQTYADFFIYTFCTLINDNIYFLKFERVVDMSLTILTNISVYIKSMGVISCDCIIAVLKKILKKEWIMSSEHHFYSLFLVLDFINNILSYNLCENYNLIYTIIKNKNVFFSIHNLYDHLKSNCYPETVTPNVYWVPTEKWLLGWKKKLPMDFINNIIYDLANLVEEECDKKEILDYDEVVNLIKDHCKIIVNKKIPFVIRKYDNNISLSKWFTNYLYFLVFFHFYKHNLFINNGVTFIF